MNFDFIVKKIIFEKYFSVITKIIYEVLFKYKLNVCNNCLRNVSSTPYVKRVSIYYQFCHFICV